MKKKIYHKADPLLSISNPVISMPYHVAWGKSNGVVGIVRSIDEVNKTVILESPKTRIKWNYPVKWSDLRHTRKMQQKIEFGLVNQ